MTMEKKARTATPKWLGVAVQALLYLNREDGKLLSSGEIAGAIGSEVTLVRRVLTRLVQAEIVTAREGREGGYMLARSPDEVTLADIYRAVEICDPICPGILPKPEHNEFCTDVAAAVSEVIEATEKQMLELWDAHTLASLASRCEQD
ncbi:RrF2 family transcriptional regulator [Paenibacillus jiagnxiensis]|uniref:RrF2 family transcriptional regulator n=1 Tax=Paenibacillus jiagnxiensis TaxID=3228926 RepID=UPI0033A4000C